MKIKSLLKPKRIWHSFLPHEWDALKFHSFKPVPMRQIRVDQHGQKWEYVSSNVKVLAKLQTINLN